MENASKALIIAGAILLAILIISLGILIYNQASSVVTNNTMSEVDIQTFNNKFTQYGGDQRGSSIRALLQQIQSSNAVPENENRQVKIDQSGDVKSLSDVKTGNLYTVTYVFSSSGSNNGLIDKIKIEDAS
mgnify:FL=1